MPVSTRTAPEPTEHDIDRVIDSLRTSWTATITVRRQSAEDVGYREVFVSLDDEEIGILKHGDEITRDIPPGHHRLKAHNTLFRNAIDFWLNVGEHASFRTANRAGFLTYSVVAFFMGGGPIYLTLERESPATPITGGE